jgi:hypothetical protein
MMRRTRAFRRYKAERDLQSLSFNDPEDPVSYTPTNRQAAAAAVAGILDRTRQVIPHSQTTQAHTHTHTHSEAHTAPPLSEKAGH